MKKRKLNIKKVLLCIVLPIILILTSTVLMFINNNIQMKDNNEINTVNIAQETVVQNEEIIEETIEVNELVQEVQIEKSIIYTTTGVNLREGPSLDDKIIKVLSINTELTKIGEENGWTKIEMGDNNYFIKSDYVSTTKTQVPVTTRHATVERKETNTNSNYLGRYKLTAYCGCAKCCGKTNCITASGTKATAGRTIAAPSNLKFGTQVSINGHTYTVEDRGGAINGNKIDIYFNSHSEALAFGVKYADVYVVK